MAEQSTLEGFNARHARVGMTGAVRAAALGTPKVPLGEKYDSEVHRNLGYLSPDGLEISFDEDKQEYIPWQEVNPIRVDVTKAVKGIKMTLWESSVENLAKFLGVPEDELISNDDVTEFYEGNLPDFPHEFLSLDVIDKGKAMRLTLFDAQITERGSLVLKKDDMVGLEITYNTYPASEADYGSTEPEAVGKTANWQFNSEWASGGRAATGESTDGVNTLKVSSGATLPELTKGEAYTATVTASGGTEPYEFSATGLPSGLSIDKASGKITGTVATVSGSIISAKVTVKDSKSLSASQQVTIPVAG